MIDKNGFTNIRFLIELENGELVFENYTYGLNTKEVILAEELPPTIKDYQVLSFDIDLAGFDRITGVIRNSGVVIEKFEKTTSALNINWLIPDGPKIKVRSGDVIEIQVNSPFFYFKSLPANRISTNGIEDAIRLNKLIELVRKEGLETISQFDFWKEFHKVTGTPNSINLSIKIKHLRDYFKK